MRARIIAAMTSALQKCVTAAREWWAALVADYREELRRREPYQTAREVTRGTSVICGTSVETFEKGIIGCVCIRSPRHAGAHECQCTGSWTTKPDGSFGEIVRLPGGIVLP